jgi:hypothetical protein
LKEAGLGALAGDAPALTAGAAEALDAWALMDRRFQLDLVLPVVELYRIEDADRLLHLLLVVAQYAPPRL